MSRELRQAWGFDNECLGSLDIFLALKQGCSGGFYLKDEQNQETDNRSLGGMAILGSDIPAVDIARVSEKNLVKRLKRKFVPSDSYLNEGVFLSKDRVNILFHSRLKKFLSLNINTKGGFMSEENREGKQAVQNA
ncbi:hypothetical protein [Borrelia sp. P9F1]|uniref:hypothetical protein n=1 Tax=Borrelia sp. P9F1 TaxID=3058374 RepID=UPI002648A9C3|nr:hypothetical protein [Borrelia sp. P9F1]WKC58536.1 hypothetical protein QYZ68_04885 [Borrelia sp. P9F1]WKC58625.1 hypothetical protein QYZ68_05335 [Borrelia sp. P9F1]